MQPEILEFPFGHEVGVVALVAEVGLWGVVNEQAVLDRPAHELVGAPFLPTGQIAAVKQRDGFAEFDF